VSHMNRVSSKGILAADSASFEVGTIFVPKLSDMLVLSGMIMLSVLFFLFVILANTAWASSIAKEKVIELANRDRKDKGISELVENKKLSRAAMDKAEDMILKNYFSHTSSEGITPWHWIEKENYDYNYAGENLAMDFASAEKMNEAWLASPTHRNNILNQKYEDIGVAVKEGVISGHATVLVVQMFGSGDKNASKEEKAGESVQKEEALRQENYIPALPSSEERAEKIAFEGPLVTSPQKSEVLNGEEIEVAGRANPKSKVAIFDNGFSAGDSLADDKGWFKLKIKNISEGSHKLAVKAESSVARENGARISNEVSFQIDRRKPSVSYHLYADNRTNNYLVRLSSDKKNCLFQLGRERVSDSFDGTAVFSIKTNQASIVATVSDQAGNKSRKQIVLANYFTGSGKSFFDSLALSFSPQTAYAADSGRKALASNLGIMTGGNK